MKNCLNILKLQQKQLNISGKTFPMFAPVKKATKSYNYFRSKFVYCKCNSSKSTKSIEANEKRNPSPFKNLQRKKNF